MRKGKQKPNLMTTFIDLVVNLDWRYFRKLLKYFIETLYKRVDRNPVQLDFNRRIAPFIKGLIIQIQLSQRHQE